MATITLGPKDGVDELLEKISAVDRILRTLQEQAKTEDRANAFFSCRTYTERLKNQSTELRAQIDVALKTSNVPTE